MSDQSQTTCKIRDFTEFLEKCLGRKVLEYTLNPLTKPGDNYGSIMLSVEVKVAEINECNKTKALHLVAKTAITNPFLVSIFQPDVTFVKEAHFYSDVVPAIELFEQIRNVPENERINAFIRCIGSRLSLDPNAKSADADAVILFENIKIHDYKNIDQRVGFDTDESLAIITQLAKFHSLCIAMRREQPELFSSEIRPFLAPVLMIIDDKETTLIDSICESVRFIDNLDPKLRDDVEKQLRVCYALMMKERSDVPEDTPYSTVIHRDFWSTNLMIKENSIANNCTQIKIYDFQLYCLGSFAHDLVLFLFTSINPRDLSKNFNLFIKHYHQEFVKMMKLANCPLDDYTLDKLRDEIQDQIRSKLLFVLHINKIIFMQSFAPSSYDEVSHDTFLKGGQLPRDTLNRWKFIIDFVHENGFI